MLQTIIRTAALILLLLALPLASSAGTKVFVKEYTYQASEVDSKVTARAIAMELVKRLLLEELGTYLVSETEAKNYQLTKDRITAISAGLVQTEILAEKWDGQSYYLKARIAADPEEVSRQIAALRTNAQQKREQEETNSKIDEALARIRQLQEELATGRHPEKARAEYVQAVDKLTANEWIQKGTALMGAEKYQEAADAFGNAIRIEPANIWAFIDRGWARNSLGDYYEALNDLNRAAEIDPRNPWPYVNRAASYNYLANHQQALRDADRALSIDPSIVWGYSVRGWANLGLGNYKQAIIDLNRGEQLDPKNPYIFSTRAWAENALGDRQKALADFDRSLALAPNSSDIHWSVAVFHTISGEKEKALSELAKAIRINGMFKQRAKTDKFFQPLWNDNEFRKLVE